LRDADGLVLNFADGESLATDMVVFPPGFVRRTRWRAAAD
jgi:hypothetical protein